MDTALFLLGCLGLMYVTILTVLAVRLPVQPGTLSLVSTVYVGGIGLWAVKSGYLRSRLTPVFTAVVIVAASITVNGLVHDSSFDGQGYHMLAIGSIKAGWNPLYAPDFLASLWVQHYPKAAWLIGAVIYCYTGLIDTGKSINLIALCAAFFSVFAYLYRLLRLWSHRFAASLATLLAVCAACNPITMVQLFTHYNDGLVGSLLLALISLLAYYTLSFERKALAAAAICIVLLLNIKFTAIAYAGLVCLFFILYLLFIERGRKEDGPRYSVMKLWRDMWRRGSRVKGPLLFLGAVGIASVVLFGFNPYVYNTVKQGHPLFPLAGKEKLDIMTHNSPIDFVGKTRLEKFYLSYTSKTEDPVAPWSSRRAELWPIRFEEFYQMEVDTRTAGFGPLTLWLGIGSLSLMLLTVIFDWRRAAAGGTAIMALLITVLINPESWWARYVPQLWLLPLVLVVTALISKRRLLRITSLLLLVIAMTNAGGAAGVSIARQVSKSTNIVKQYAGLQAIKGASLRVYPESFFSIPYRLKEYGVSFELVEPEQLCENSLRFLYTQGSYCEGEGEQ